MKNDESEGTYVMLPKSELPNHGTETHVNGGMYVIFYWVICSTIKYKYCGCDDVGRTIFSFQQEKNNMVFVILLDRCILSFHEELFMVLQSERGRSGS